MTERDYESGMAPWEKYILLVEDDPVVAELVLHTFASLSPSPKVVLVHDGVEALDFLYAREQYVNREAADPAVVLLDVKMPRMDGLEVLRQIKSDEQLKCTPVVMLTSSQDERDVRTSYLYGANAYIVKPVEYRKFAKVLQQLDAFWLGVNLPPPDHRTAAIAAHAH